MKTSAAYKLTPIASTNRNIVFGKCWHSNFNGDAEAKYVHNFDPIVVIQLL